LPSSANPAIGSVSRWAHVTFTHSLLLWLKRIAWGWFLYWISSRRKMTAHLENFLYQQRFPQPPHFVTGIDDYLAKIANDNRVSPPMRVKAATKLGLLAGIKTSGNMLYAMQLFYRIRSRARKIL